MDLTTSATGPDGNTNEQRPNLVPGQPLYLAGGNFNPAAFCTPGTSDPLYPVAPAPRTSAMSPAISCEVPGSGKWIWGFPNAFLLQNSYNFSSGPKRSTFSTGPKYANPDGLISASDFGIIYLPLNTTPIGMGTPRQFQFLLKLQF